MYAHIFFDLDHTLWDFDTNSREALFELNDAYNLKSLGVESIEDFISEYLVINDQMWELYRKGLVDKETLRFERFHRTLLKFGIDNESVTKGLGIDYSQIAPLKTNLIPDTIEVLNYLKDKYILHIITNGFDEVQGIKMKHSGIEHYFSEVITSEMAGCKKPDPGIFKHALDLANAQVENSIMIGDNLEADIVGAREVGIDQIYFNPKNIDHREKVTHEIKELKSLLTIL